MNIQPKKHIVIFSHGFGVRKDDLGLLTNIAESIPEVESVLFDYYKVDDLNNILTLCPFSQQVEMLNNKVNEVRAENPDAVIDIIAHSQGTTIAVLAKPGGVRKVLLLAMPFDMGLERTLKRYETKAGCHIDLEGVSTLYPLGGYTRIIPKEYWAERKAVNVFKECNEFAEKSELIVVRANQDTLVPDVDLKDLSLKVELVKLDGDHSFNGDARDGLIKAIREIILNNSGV